MVFLLVIIYIAFISLGLPDSLLGSAWPSMFGSFGVSISSAGIVSMIVSLGTIISSLFSDRVITRFGAGKVTLVSVFMTAAALLGVSFSGSFAFLCVCAVPLGLGAGSVDAGLNGFVAKHYEAKHMNWLHSFWGLGASAGPLIMSFCLINMGSWKMGFRTISIIQFALVAVLLFSLPLWKKAGSCVSQEEAQRKPAKLRDIIRLPGAKAALLSFFFYCSLESTVGLWGSTYLVTVRGIAAETAASWISLFYVGITLGRFLSGFLAMKLKNRRIIVLGLSVITLGAALLFLPFGGAFLLVAFFLIGMGCAPVFPSILHDTPENFGDRYAQAIMGVQMASAYVGTTFMPPLFGLLGGKLGYSLFPYFAAAMLLGLACAVKVLFLKTKNNKL